MRPMLTCFLFISDSYYTSGKLKAAFLRRVNGSALGELNFCEGEPKKIETGKLM